jgi:hypothetical protein
MRRMVTPTMPATDLGSAPPRPVPPRPAPPRPPPGLFLLPSRLRRDLLAAVLLKAALLTLLYWLFFSPSRWPAIDAAAHIAGRLPH